MSWADAIPPKQGLYGGAEAEKDACGVGFIVSVKGEASHKVVADARYLLCNMTHRGASGADIRDGDGAGVMTAIPHDFFAASVAAEHGIDLPEAGQYATGNVYLNPQEPVYSESKRQFEAIAAELGLAVLCWRRVPRKSAILGPFSRAKEPAIEQPFVALAPGGEPFDAKRFAVLLYILRKRAAHRISLRKWFYTCSLHASHIVYKGLLAPVQVYDYFYDLHDVRFASHFALVHSRFSTNTFPSWDRAQPLRLIGHNGEINTLRGNKNWMRAREGIMTSATFGKDIDSLYPIVEDFGSDSAALDNVLELLVLNGVLTLPEAVMMLVPEANYATAGDERQAFYEWAGTLMEPWDGPALVTFADGRYVGAQLDRNGLRPCRYYLLEDDMMICASEVGTVTVDPKLVVSKGRLMPGRMLLVDTVAQRLVDDTELKRSAGIKIKRALGLESNSLHVPQLREIVADPTELREQWVVQRQQDLGGSLQLDTDPRLVAFGYTIESLQMVLVPMMRTGKEALGSMGNDAPLACLSLQPKLAFDYFRQLFAQVTNPPIDPIREKIVMSTHGYLGKVGNLLTIEMRDPEHPLLAVDHPIVLPWELPAVTAHLPSRTLAATYPVEHGPDGLVAALDALCAAADEAIADGVHVLVIDDSAMDADSIPIPSALAIGTVHHHLVRTKQRGHVSLVAHVGDAREVHHMCVLLGYGADAIVPYLVVEAALSLGADVDKYVLAVVDGIRKVMSKMGISTLQSYRGAQIFEILGMHDDVVAKCFHGTASRIQGVGFPQIAADVLCLHARAYPRALTVQPKVLPEAGDYHYRAGGEMHINDPTAIASLQDAVRMQNKHSYAMYAQTSQQQVEGCTLRGCLDFVNPAPGTAIPLDEVEPWTAIVTRFCTGAMSYGSISLEAHTALARAMNTLGGKSNTGEGGEDESRTKDPAVRSAIKQVASGRFGVTCAYLTDADELQIKMAQGAKPGEGGELPGHKVSKDIAKTRKSTPGVGLISPPPHHDIYSIEDLKQLIFDLKSVNPIARVSVKLVSEVGVGVIAAGVAKAGAHHILISGHDGGTGASRWTGIKYAGLPWELGLAETHQTLVLNNLRGRVILQTDGQLRTGRDLAIACMLGGEEFGFATTPLIAMGCTMMRKCHLNTCPVGIATQDPTLRAKFAGEPEHVINFFHYIAEELREIMASLGVRTVAELVGRTDLLQVNPNVLRGNPKSRLLDLQPLLLPAHSLRQGVPTHVDLDQWKQPTHDDLNHKDLVLLQQAALAIEQAQPMALTLSVCNTDRSIGALLSHHISKRYGEVGLPPNTLRIHLFGSAGQSFGVWLAPGITLELEGDANDYVGKGLSGGTVVICPPRSRHDAFVPSKNVIVGNTCAYGATSGSLFVNGMAAERFCVRNSGATAVVEGVGDHGCEYMTGGRCIVLGSTGRNFAAGMSGGIAYVLDLDASKCNADMVDLDPVTAADVDELRGLIAQHVEFTGSAIGSEILDNWDVYQPRFTKVFPRDFKAVLAKQQQSLVKPVEVVQTPVVAEAHHAEQAIADIEDAMARLQPDPRGKILPAEDAPLDKVKGFNKYRRTKEAQRPVARRIKDYDEIAVRMKPRELRVQAARCMDCGVPFCQSATGCPIGNLIPRWNELVFREDWRAAYDRLALTNNFPEFTGRVCPAPCEGACVLGINEDPVSIKSIEAAIIDRAFEEGWIVPNPPASRSEKRVAIIGSGPAGLAAADMLNRAGHSVTVYEREDAAGGLLQYGIPNMKLDKRVVQRRVQLLADEGVEFKLSCEVGKDVPAQSIVDEYDATLLAVGATWPRDLKVPNRDLNGIYFAVDYLTRSTKLRENTDLSAEGKKVLVIGAGDTSTDCIGTALRQGATSITAFDLLPPPPPSRAAENPWPEFPRVFKVDYGHHEVAVTHGRDPRLYNTMTTEFVSDGDGNVKGVNTVQVEWTKDAATGRWAMTQVPGSHAFVECDLVFLAMGFMGPEAQLREQLALATTPQSNIQADNKSYATSVPGVFAAGDCRRGQSLIVWGIREGREAARAIDVYLSGETVMPVTGGVQQRAVADLEVNKLVATDMVVAEA
ncbi:glutamate synthase, NADH/NADPH, small subunit [Allomyces macrogynus ATCC 38327]|uniref:Glutamate synthase [NADH] n=1 Tax=Allomyces macrogynus (strain ATCC 38327) TaxID=578462 RepID=A0A0L0T4P3_ALLM3|nr:glutamate synthase, NADH/NADPH, small subunit [Allomyces macrogynus ATCC 38327]|eukprot:KNE69707.1 glutamate synthase, NADH/NADPH, small subunit [Allomyces macrogynus ATCC 38327]